MQQYSTPDDEPTKAEEILRKYGGYDPTHDVELYMAEAFLREHGGYDWLLSTRNRFWSVSEIVEELDKTGLKVSNRQVVYWFKALDYTFNFPAPVGRRATKQALVKFFARSIVLRKGPFFNSQRQ